MSRKRYDNVSESSSDEEEYDGRGYKNSCSSNEKFNDYEDDRGNESLKNKDISSSSFEMTRKRGRGHTKRPCMNKNAQAARENRIRKKKHLEQVENKLLFYQQKNKSLVNIVQKQDIDIKKLKGEVSYLRCILRNNTNITALLQSMNEGLSKTSNNKQLSIGRNSKSNSENQQRLLKSITNNQLSKRNGVSHSEFDHTYTISETRSIDGVDLNNGYVNENEKYENLENCENAVFADEILLDFENGPSATSPLSNSDELFNGNISDTEIDEWSGLNVNIHDNFTNLDEGLSPSDNLDKLSNLYDDSNVLEQFRDAGICLHVNSDKVSLEFCSICHMNSINSMPE